MTPRGWLLIAGVVVTLATLWGLRREHIRAEYSASWLAGGAALILGGLWGRPLTLPAGLGADINLVALLGGALMLGVAVFQAARILSRIQDEKVQLVQKNAILEFRVRYPAAHSSGAIGGVQTPEPLTERRLR